MSRLRQPSWRLAVEVTLWRYGWSAVLGLALAVAGGSIWALHVVPQRQVLQQEAEAAVVLPAPRSAVPEDPQAALRRSSGEMLGGLPPASGANMLIGSILGEARRHGLSLNSLDSQHRDDTRLHWVQVTVTVPVRGSYSATRRFVEALMREHPNLALDHVALRRDGAAADAADAVLRFTAWYRRPDGGSLAPEPVGRMATIVEVTERDPAKVAR